MKLSPRTILCLAVAADVDPRTARKALRDGLTAVRGRASERLAEAAPALGVTFPTPKETPSSEAA